MIITRGIENAKFVGNTIATIGSYDGIHLGHQDILSALVQKKNIGGYSRSVVLTFDPHPQEILHKKDTTVELLTTIDERLNLLGKAGIDETVIIEFSLEFSQTPYAIFFRDVLLGRLGVTAMVVGFNHAFGKNREGDLAHLKELALAANVSITAVAPHILDGIEISSTRIRRSLLSGDIATANLYLGRSYHLRGVVVSGDKLGRTLGFPTANLKIPTHKLTPKDGVYAGIAYYENKKYIAAVSIGTRPTVTDSSERIIEAMLLDFAGDLYGKELSLDLCSYIREQVAFDSLESLQHQMTDDIRRIKTIMKNVV